MEEMYCVCVAQKFFRTISSCNGESALGAWGWTENSSCCCCYVRENLSISLPSTYSHTRAHARTHTVKSTKWASGQTCRHKCVATLLPTVIIQPRLGAPVIRAVQSKSTRSQLVRSSNDLHRQWSHLPLTFVWNGF